MGRIGKLSPNVTLWSEKCHENASLKSTMKRGWFRLDAVISFSTSPLLPQSCHSIAVHKEPFFNLGCLSLKSLKLHCKTDVLTEETFPNRPARTRRL